MFEISLPHIMAMLVGSGIGYVYVSWGRSQADWTLVGSGMALMVYSYFITSLLGLLIVGAGIASVPFVCKRST